MKKFTLMLLGLALFAAHFSVQAQEKGAPGQITIVKKVTGDDGDVTVIKKKLAEGETVIQDLKNLDDLKGENVEIHILNEAGEEIQLDGGETILYIRKAKEDLQEMKAEMEKMDQEMKKVRIFMHGDKFGGEKMKELHQLQNIEKERPILGIYPGEDTGGEGITIGSLVSEGGAQAAGLAGGDVITMVDGQSVTQTHNLQSILSKHKVGDAVKVNYIRNGQPAETTVTLSRANDKFSFNYAYERDPCKVFIGIYCSGNGDDGQGVRVSGIIDQTAAAKFGVESNDIILSMDDVPTNSYGELLRERNKHQPGDWFTLNILRDGKQMEVDAQFNPCEKTAEEVVQPVEETIVVEEIVEEQIIEPKVQPDFQLLPESWNLYPNPTFGRLQLEFQAEPLPTTIRIQDVSGKAVFNETINQFNGYYNEAIDLSRAVPGQYLLSVQQGDKIKTEKIVLMPRA